MAKKNLFTQVQMTQIKSNVFDLSHDVKLSMKMGDLVPIMCTECVPGDKFSIGCESLIRFAPLVAPVMHRFDVTMHYFFVPNRIVWPNWEQYITGGKEGSSVPAFPTFQLQGNSVDNFPLLDYFGIPHGPAGHDGDTCLVSAIPFAAYQAIYNEYYRDENLVDEVITELVDGSNDANNGNFLSMRKRAWEHDYFTSCLPFAQKGSIVDLPVGSIHIDDAQVRRNTASTGGTTTVTTATGTSPLVIPQVHTGEPDIPVDGLYADTEGDYPVQATTITDLRRATKLQEFLERAARGGTRYIEFILSMFGVHSSDKRLQRPEYITGVKSPVVISEVLNTAGNSDLDLPQGNMAGHGVSVVNGYSGSFYCEEHGYIIGIMSVMPKTAYQQGIPKHFLKINDRYEFYFEQFAHIGEQAVLNKEIYAFNGGTDTDTFGYIPRYAEYKFESNRTAGDFRDTLDYWTETRQFGSLPVLNQEFIECVPDTRIFAVEDGTDYLWCHVYNKVKAVRKMPYFGNPRF